MKFKGKTVLVTGASGNIGGAIANQFAEEGAYVIVHCNKNHQGAEELVAKLVSKGLSAGYARFDVTEYHQVNQEIHSILKSNNKIDILVNNAGTICDKLMVLMTDSEWQQVIDVNLKGTVNCCRAVVDSMIAQSYGKIINISSITGLAAQKMRTNYGASKRAIIGLTKCLARELAQYGISVNAIAPQVVKGGVSKHASKQELEQLREFTPVGELAECTDVASTVTFLADDNSRFITGSIINMTGGLITWQV